MIRRLEKEDIDNVMQIWIEENIKAHNFIKKEYWENNYVHVKKTIPAAEIYVYVIQEKIVGFIGLNKNYIEGIFVDQNNQGKGIGTSLLNKAKENRSNLKLHVYQKNMNAINFYKKNEFTVIEESVNNDTKEAEYVMTWNREH